MKGCETISRSDSLEKLKSGLVTEERWAHYFVKFGSIFVNDNVGKNVTYSLSIQFKLKKEENYLKLHEQLFMKKNLSDVKLVCDGKTFECHKLVLSCQSDVFEAMFKNEMVESESGEVKIKDVKADALENMVYFMYHDKV